MELAEHLAEIAARLQAGDYAIAFKRMAESVAPYLSDEALFEAIYNEHLAEMFALVEDGNPSKSVRKDQRKMDRIMTMTQHLYHNVPKKIAKWGHEAHAEGLRAFGMDRSKHAPAKMKLAAHHAASQAHQIAAQHLANAGHKDSADLHMRAANYHKKRHAEISSEHGADEMPAESNSREMNMRDWRHRSAAVQEAKKDKQDGDDDDEGDDENDGDEEGEQDVALNPLKQPDSAVAFPKDEAIQNWVTDLDEGEYHDDVKQASMLAANATKQAKMPNATVDHHETAARLHFIAHGVAKAHGHEELATKHMDMMNKHREAAKQARLAS
jgi:hypothetical protein